MTRISRALALAALVGNLVACSDDAPASAGAVDAQSDAVVAEDTASDARDSGPVDSFVPTDSLVPGVKGTTIEIGGFMVAAGAQVTKCAVIPLGEIEPRFLRAARLQLGTGVHEVAVYRAPGPTSMHADCVMFSGLTMPGPMLLLGHAPDATLTLPDTPTGPVGMTLSAGTFLRVELQALNPTSGPIAARATLTLATTEVPTNAVEAAAALSINTAISIPPMASATAERFQAGVASTSVFAMMLHTHVLGTAAEARFGASVTDSAATKVYTTSTPSQGPLTTLSPALAMPPGSGTVSAKGLAYKCTYMNTRTTTVTFGNSLSAEQCMLLSWYYPSQGFHFCIDDSCSYRP